MVAVIWMPEEMPAEAHVVVVAHTAGLPKQEKGYFFISSENDWGGSGPFDMKLDDVLERAKGVAADKGLKIVVVTRSNETAYAINSIK